MLALSSTPPERRPTSRWRNCTRNAPRARWKMPGSPSNDVDGYFCAGDAPGMGPLSMVDYMDLSVRHVDATDIGGSSYLMLVAHAAEAIAAGRCNVALITLAGRPRSEGWRPERHRVPAIRHSPTCSSSTRMRRRSVNMYAMCAHAPHARIRHHVRAARLDQGRRLAPRAAQSERRCCATWSRSRMWWTPPSIASPLHRLDCCVISDGGGALVVVKPEIAAQPEATEGEVMRRRRSAEGPDAAAMSISPIPAHAGLVRRVRDVGVKPADINTHRSTTASPSPC